ncbi:hypothetical protein RHGRI_003278 [Rhododendron griersonianum]|uniref:Mitochondrial transcription termination factor family protein n=1 Tax=Rhododendron griersonianum TaxID=479676 RepID=A0AAV6L6N0_9ERIC|nr:hypothetical protein RHGRI_003278 [Rhododendron griersonianum]
MFKFISRISARGASPAHNLYLFQIQPFSSSLEVKSKHKSSNQYSFTVKYLINSFGFTPEKALSASKHVKFETPDKPDSVVALFKNHGFTRTQISTVIKKFPSVLVCDAKKTLLPKLQFLNSKRVSSTDVAVIVSTSPHVLKCSLKNVIIPSFDFFSNLLQSEEKAVAAIKRYSGIFWVDHQAQVTPHIQVLREANVPEANIMYLLMKQPRTFMVKIGRFREVVEEVEKMGFNHLRMSFVSAVHAVRALSKSTWDKKVEVYKKWGLTDDEFLAAFKKYPGCVKVSENKIDELMDFLVNKTGWGSSFFVRRPEVVSLSLEKRIVPRNAVYQALWSKGLITSKDIRLETLLLVSETRFLEKVLSYQEEAAPELLKLYKEKLDLAK